MSVALTIVILTWVLMPLGHRLLHRWLDPVEGATPQANLRGVATVFAGFAVSMTIFGTVGFLQH
jgi:antibiotic biosynthesis monooxygenase (ABM) superfamily enzyme